MRFRSGPPPPAEKALASGLSFATSANPKERVPLSELTVDDGSERGDKSQGNRSTGGKKPRRKE